MPEFKISIEHSPDVETDADRLFHVVDRSGGFTVDRAMEPATFFVYLNRGRRAIAEWVRLYGPVPRPEDDVWPEVRDGHVRISVHIDEPPTIHIDEQRYIRVVDRRGDSVMDRAMKAGHFLVYLERGDVASAEWQKLNAAAG
jgi:hypothetical protein